MHIVIQFAWSSRHFIKVVDVVTGSVKSNISRPNALPAHSLYKLMEKAYQEKRINVSQKNAMPTEIYARTVVTEVLEPKPRAWFWAGNQVFWVWLLDTFLGRTAFDWFLARSLIQLPPHPPVLVNLPFGK
ncbi:putative enoyl-(Acyl carrier protein) reductase [Lyophyllum shimeji]|uniref:Enoyl-(Acyl carrier protein) reductase n=1 Tax=Lyophyllum shimeji TaxID=47721 RepID=A0A9P3PR27_LYOSH|nr:putative enoyl-(Acyl carrier protein) reductase [Lyophyllum shimeji]